ncbi:MAG TPA: hypothetical protein VMD30_01615, partial [Tepidisphaeraceae bacterium]|nr:hypothetical protein [Tepidisphaeraceae bacterium]
SIIPIPGGGDLADGDLTVRYQPERGSQKSITFTDTEITVADHFPGNFVEQIPLLAPGGQINLSANRATVDYGATQLIIAFDDATASVLPTKTIIAKKVLTVLRLSAKDALTYDIRFASTP